MFRTLVIPVFAATLSLAAAPCFAQNQGSLQKAKQLFEKGETQYRLGKFRRALGSYESALAQARRSSIIFNIGQCHRQLKNWKKALFYYNLYLSDWERQNPTKPPPYYAEVKSHIREAKRNIRKAKQKPNLEDWGELTGTLRLDGLPGGARVYVNGALRGKAPMEHPMELKTGKHRVTVEHAGVEPWGKTVIIASGELTREPVTLVVHKRSGERNTLWLGLGITSAVLALGSEITALVFTSKANDVLKSDPDFETYKGAAIAGHVGMGVFAAGAIASFVAYYFSGDSDTSTSSARLLPTPGGVVFTWQF